MRVPHFRPPLRARMRHDIVLVGCFSCWLFWFRKLELELLAKKSFKTCPYLFRAAFVFENVGPFMGPDWATWLGATFGRC